MLENLRFKVWKSVHHRTIQIDHQPDATIFQFIILTFIYRSTGFGLSHAHHQELNNCSSSLWFYLRTVVIDVLCSWLGRPDHEHSTTVTTIRRKNQRLPLKSLTSWWWAGKRPKHVELYINVRIINRKIVASGWWFIWNEFEFRDTVFENFCCILNFCLFIPQCLANP